MNKKIAKKLRKQYREKINGMATITLRKEIFRLARNRDTLGIILILESIALITILFLYLR
jgi:hypothetical protein